MQVTKAAARDGHHLEFDIPFDQLGFGGKPFKEVRTSMNSKTKALLKYRQQSHSVWDGYR